MIDVDKVTSTLCRDSNIIILRPLWGWANGRKITLQFTDLPSTIEAKLESFGAIDNGPSSSLSNDGKIEIDFTNVHSDSVKLNLFIPGGESKNFTIKLFSGMQKSTLIMDGTNTSNNSYKDFSSNEDKEFKIAVDENYVYVLVMNRNSGGNNDITREVLTDAEYAIYVYSI